MGRKEILSIFVLLSMVILPMGAIGADMTAGDFDDNLNFDHYTKYVDDELQEDEGGILPDVYLKDRISIKIEDETGRGLPNFRVRITEENSEEVLVDTYSGFDGTFRFFPTFDGYSGSAPVRIDVFDPNDGSWNLSRVITPDQLTGERELNIIAENASFRTPGTLEISFVVDTTGSMGDELEYLKREFENIIESINSTYQVETMRFSLVLYRDLGDEYVVRDFDFTESISEMKQNLNIQHSSGGGDYPEAMEKAIEAANGLSWSEGNSARIMFLVADAPPHNNNLEAAVDAISDSREKGIHIYPLASSGVADIAEFIMRLASVTTHGRYLFLTDDSGIGNSHAEPHIPGYIVTTLKDLMVRIIDSEISGHRVEATEDQMIRKVGNVNNGVVLKVEQEEEEEEDQQYENVTNEDEVEIEKEDVEPSTPVSEEDKGSDPKPAPSMDDAYSSEDTSPISPDMYSGSSTTDPSTSGIGDSTDGEIYAWDTDTDCDSIEDGSEDEGKGIPELFSNTKDDEDVGAGFFSLIFVLTIAAVGGVILIVSVVYGKKRKKD